MIFISYASEDRERVVPFYDLLQKHGLDPWMDCKNILGGQNWDYEIKTALDRSEIIVVFVSQNSVDKRGYAQREIKLAIKKYEEKLVNDIYIIPVQLDDGEFPHLLSGIHFIRGDENTAKKELLKSVSAAKEGVDQKHAQAQEEADLHWSTFETKSNYSGIPGYSTNVQRISLFSDRYQNLNDISDQINGELARLAMSTRWNALTPNPEVFHIMQDSWKRTDTFDAIFSSASVVGRAFSVTYSLNWYSGGAAHPTHSPKTFNFLLEPTCNLSSAKNLFLDTAALLVLQQEVEKLLVTGLFGSDIDSADLKWIAEGTKDWESFSNFAFTSEGLALSFGSYQVAGYAAGMPSVVVPFERLLPLFNELIVHALGLHRT